MMTTANQLEIPDAAKNDPESFEVLRVWIAEGDQQLSLRVGVWDDLGAWGILLADLARHIVQAHAQSQQINAPATLARIKAALDAELSEPTDQFLNH